MNELVDALRREQRRNERLAEKIGRTHPMCPVYLALARALGNVAAELEDGPPDDERETPP